MIQVTAFKWVPPFAQGSVRDIRVRWALEEAGLGYDDHLIGFEDQSTPAYRARQPFGQVPAFSDGKVEMFESGAIVLYIGQNSDQLMPADQAGRAMVMTWLFAAMNSVEPMVAELATIDLFNPEKAWAKERRPEVETMPWGWMRTDESGASLAHRAVPPRGRVHAARRVSRLRRAETKSSVVSAGERA